MLQPLKLPPKFYEQIEFEPVAFGGHWRWRGSRNKRGYGLFRFQGKQRYVHRLICDLLDSGRGGPQANHICDLRSCCNVSHVYVGDQAMNVWDAAAAGRYRHWRRPRGLAHARAVHPFGVVLEARRLRRQGLTAVQIGKRLGVKADTVRKWCARKNRAAA